MKKISLLFIFAFLLGHVNAQNAEQPAPEATKIIAPVVVRDTVYHETTHRDTVFIEVENKEESQGERIITDRPKQSVGATIIPKSTLQVETGAKVVFTPGGSAASSHVVAPAVLVRLGVSEYFEARLSTSFQSYKTPAALNRNSGIGDLELGAKIRLLDKEDVPTKVALVSHLVIPTGSRGISYESFRAISKFSVSHVLSDMANLGYNVGFNYYDDINGDLTYSVVLDLAISEKVEVFIEPYGQYTRLLTYEASFDAGLKYLLSQNMQVDFAYGTGLNYKMNFLSVGFSWNVVQTKK